MSFPFQIRAPATQLDTGRDLVYPCKYFMNGLPCRFTECSFSHDLGLMDRWKSGPGRKLCRNGMSCRHLQNKVCLYAHHPTQHEANNWLDLRTKAMKLNLEFLQELVPSRRLSLLPVKISESLYLASFNKLTPTTISVPGHPPAFHPPTSELPINLQSNAFEYPTYTYPFAPLLHSIALTTPSYDLATTDLVTTSINLRKLFFLLANSRRLSNRFEIEVHGSTMFLSSWTTNPAHQHAGGNYGRAFKTATCRFPKHLTQTGETVSHHRVEGYRIGGLQCVVQSVIDGYLCKEHCKGHKDKELSVHKMEPPGSELKIHHSGSEVPERCLVHIEAQNMYRNTFVSPEAQMYFSRRTKLYRALRYDVVFQASCATVVDLTDRLENWEIENALALGKLVDLLKTVRQQVETRRYTNCGVNKFSLLCESDGMGDMGHCAVRLCKRNDQIDLLPRYTGVLDWDLESVVRLVD